MMKVRVVKVRGIGYWLIETTNPYNFKTLTWLDSLENLLNYLRDHPIAEIEFSDNFPEKERPKIKEILERKIRPPRKPRVIWPKRGK